MTIQILKPQIETTRTQIGRPEAITKEKVLYAIALYGTSSPTELAKRLNVSRRTIYRRLDYIPKQEIEDILRDLAESELKPYQMQYDVFRQIPIVQEFIEALENREVSLKRKNSLVRLIFRICCYLKVHPKSLTIEHCITVKNKAKKRECKISVSEMKKAIRSWFENKREGGLTGERLTALGIDGGHGEGYGTKSTERLNREERAKFIKALDEITRDDPLHLTWIALPYFYYYSGTRAKAGLGYDDSALIETMKKHGDALIIKVIDKGRHKNGRLIWFKKLLGEPKEKIEQALKQRGNPKEGRIFPFKYRQVLKTFKDAYRKANIPIPDEPIHIWRHTAYQEFLDACGWNYTLACEVLGSKNESVVRECYGRMGDKRKDIGLRKAMGLPVEEIKKEFKF